ncbi:MAG: SusE domain-containing protein [Chitinophagaceae bacterium]|nr:SusE domain-containing protein [Chitinophagaceae bacterium]
MKNILKLVVAIFALTAFFAACSKVDNLKKSEPLPVYQLGLSPVLSSSTATVTATLADSTNSVITFSWTSPKYANDSSTTKYVVEIDTTGGGFTNPASKTVSGILSTTLTGRELNAILLGYGFPVGTAKSVDVRLISSYANNNERYMSNIVKVTVNVFGDPSVLAGSVTTVALSLANAANNAIDFSWTRSFTGYNGGISYTLQYDSAGKGFVAPLELALSAATAVSKSVNQGDLNTAAMNAGITGGTSGKLEFRIKAVTALGAIVYSNVFLLTVDTYFPIRRFYMPGGYQSSTGNGTDWTPGDAPEFIRDQRAGLLNNMYYMYIYLPGGQEFKITQGRSWDVNYGGSGGTLAQNGANFSVPTSGFYRISFNASTMRYDIREGRMGFVGGATGAGWNPPNVFPNYAMGGAATNLFVGLTDFTTDGWKLIDNDQWNNGSNAVDETRSYGSSGASGSSLETNGPNFPNITTAGRYRVIWDGRDRDNVKYVMNEGAEMRVVGDGLQGVNAWDPGASPQMTYLGNGRWQLVATLIAGKDIKFLAGNAWGAFDYEDNSGGNTATGVARGIKWEGGDNFKTPAATGTYTIILDENAQTVTIN